MTTKLKNNAYLNPERGVAYRIVYGKYPANG